MFSVQSLASSFDKLATDCLLPTFPDCVDYLQGFMIGIIQYSPIGFRGTVMLSSLMYSAS